MTDGITGDIRGSDQVYDDAVALLLDLTSDGNSGVLGDLKAMRQNQYKHEQAWSSGRQNIIERYNQKRELNKVLQNIGGQAGTADAALDADQSAELLSYDRKLHFAMQSMYSGQQTELRSLGIPRLPKQEQNDRLLALLDEILDRS